MGDFPRGDVWVPPPVLCTLSLLAFGNPQGTAGPPASATWPAANKAYFYPFTLPVRVQVSKFFFFNGGTISGNIDIGIYDSQGNKLVSTGAVAQAGANAIQAIDCTDTYIGPGEYYLAASCSSGTATGRQLVITGATDELGGMQTGLTYQLTAAHPLPATATPVDNTDITPTRWVFGMVLVPNADF